MDKKVEYIEKYQKENIRRVVVKLNRKTEQYLIDKLDEVSNVQGYLKALLASDTEIFESFRDGGKKKSGE